MSLIQKEVAILQKLDGPKGNHSKTSSNLTQAPLNLHRTNSKSILTALVLDPNSNINFNFVWNGSLITVDTHGC